MPSFHVSLTSVNSPATKLVLHGLGWMAARQGASQGVGLGLKPCYAPSPKTLEFPSKSTV